MAEPTKAQLLAEVEALRTSLARDGAAKQRAETKLAEAVEQQTATSEILRVIAH